MAVCLLRKDGYSLAYPVSLFGYFKDFQHIWF